MPIYQDLKMEKPVPPASAIRVKGGTNALVKLAAREAEGATIARLALD